MLYDENGIRPLTQKEKLPAQQCSSATTGSRPGPTCGIDLPKKFQLPAWEKLKKNSRDWLRAYFQVTPSEWRIKASPLLSFSGCTTTSYA